MRYEADEQPHSEVWLELDESEQIDAVMDYHRRTRVKLENPELHATAHVVVENQVALGEATSVPAELWTGWSTSCSRSDISGWRDAALYPLAAPRAAPTNHRSVSRERPARAACWPISF